MKKLILRSAGCAGDTVLLTAAVRDLHTAYPGAFITDVRTIAPELWYYNPYITPLADNADDATILDCDYPLVHSSNFLPRHCIEGYTAFLSEQLNVPLVSSAFKGDLYLAYEEKVRIPLIGNDLPSGCAYWLLAAGGKYDITIKWWSPQRYQEVVDYFQGRIVFVQVGAPGDYHPRINGTIDLRGKSSLRELVQLVYHSQGALCPVTLLMHLAAGVEMKYDHPRNRPCVVIAGGREPPHWEAYPHHQFIHTVGALPCCEKGGCWRCRTLPLGDGHAYDRPDFLCVDAMDGLPRCMDLISAQDVIRRIETYLQGAALSYPAGTLPQKAHAKY
jgi:ADP-heptose:LPS heptosyltransferase